jgi:hypothetical protein
MFKVIILDENGNVQSESDLCKNSKMTIKVKNGNLETNISSQQTNITQQVIKGNGNIMSGTGDVYYNK